MYMYMYIILHKDMYIFYRYIFSMTSGVMCLDIHSEHPFLLAVGLYDGTVAVYDLREGPNNPIYKSTARMGKHTDPVWQVSDILE